MNKSARSMVVETYRNGSKPTVRGCWYTDGRKLGVRSLLLSFIEISVTQKQPNGFQRPRMLALIYSRNLLFDFRYPTSKRYMSERVRGGEYCLL